VGVEGDEELAAMPFPVDDRVTLSSAIDTNAVVDRDIFWIHGCGDIDCVAGRSNVHGVLNRLAGTLRRSAIVLVTAPRAPFT
jgi:hypothetical protein